MKTKKVKLEQFRITSFVTSMDATEQNTVKAGNEIIGEVPSSYPSVRDCPSEGCETQNVQQCPSWIDACPSAMICPPY